MAAPTQKDVEALSYEDLFNLYHLVKAELEKKRLVREAEIQLKDLTERYKAAVSDDPAKKLDSVAKDETVGPGQKLIIDGVEWTNSSGAFLSPHTAGPSQYPQGWQRTGASTPNPAAVPLWKIDTQYKVGGRSQLRREGLQVPAGAQVAIRLDAARRACPMVPSLRPLLEGSTYEWYRTGRLLPVGR